jgi:hypothetical protein
MQKTEPFSRRDPRYEITPERGRVEFADPRDPSRSRRGSLRKISVCGLSFEIGDPQWRIPRGTVLSAEVVVGACHLAGEIIVRDVRPLDDDRIEIGALFHPASESDELLLLGLVTGIEAAAPESTQRPDSRAN